MTPFKIGQCVQVPGDYISLARVFDISIPGSTGILYDGGEGCHVWTSCLKPATEEQRKKMLSGLRSPEARRLDDLFDQSSKLS